MEPKCSLLQSQVHAPKFHFLKFDFNFKFPTMPGSPKFSLSLRFLYQNPIYASNLTMACYMTRQSHYFRFCHMNDNCWGELCKLHYWKLLLLYVQTFSITIPARNQKEVNIFFKISDFLCVLTNDFKWGMWVRVPIIMHFLKETISRLLKKHAHLIMKL
jgi:hypothetical protein